MRGGERDEEDGGGFVDAAVADEGDQAAAEASIEERRAEQQRTDGEQHHHLEHARQVPDVIEGQLAQSRGEEREAEVAVHALAGAEADGDERRGVDRPAECRRHAQRVLGVAERLGVLHDERLELGAVEAGRRRSAW